MSLIGFDSEGVVAKKRRVTVLFPKDGQDIPERVLREDGTLILDGHSGEVQDRVSLQIERSNGTAASSQHFRVTWKRNAGVDVTPLKGQLAQGFNVFVEKKQGNDNIRSRFIDTPLGSFFHSGKFDNSVLDEFLPKSFNDLLFNYSSSHDIDLYVKDNTVEVNIYHNLSETEHLNVDDSESGIVKTEAGFFHVDTQDDVDISLSGLRCTFEMGSGKLNKCQKTLLFYKPIHLDKSSNVNVTINVLEPINLHPVIQIDLSSFRPIHNCEYYAYLNLPKQLFVDKFQSSPVFLFGEQDLELPEYKLSGYGSTSLFTLKPGELNDIPLHSRYIKPEADASEYFVASFAPHVFYACDGNQGLEKGNPFYQNDLRYDSFFTPDTKFYHLNSTSLAVSIPKLNSDNNLSIHIITLSVVVLSFLYLIRRLFK